MRRKKHEVYSVPNNQLRIVITIEPIFYACQDKIQLECTVNGETSQIPMVVANVANSMTTGMDGLALAHPYYEGRSCSKFGLTLPSGLGDSVTDRLMDAGRTEK